MKSLYTSRQGQFLAFIHQYTTLHGRAPAEAEMEQFFHVTAPSVHQMILTLERCGLITRTPGVARSIRLNLPPEDLPPLKEDSAAATASLAPAHRAFQVAGSLPVIADRLARLAQFEFAKTVRREELLHDLAPVLFKRCTGVVLRLKAGVEKSAVVRRGLVKVFDQRNQRWFRPLADLPADTLPTGGFLFSHASLKLPKRIFVAS